MACSRCDCHQLLEARTGTQAYLAPHSRDCHPLLYLGSAEVGGAGCRWRPWLPHPACLCLPGPGAAGRHRLRAPEQDHADLPRPLTFPHPLNLHISCPLRPVGPLSSAPSCFAPSLCLPFPLSISSASLGLHPLPYSHFSPHPQACPMGTAVKN